MTPSFESAPLDAPAPPPAGPELAEAPPGCPCWRYMASAALCCAAVNCSFDRTGQNDLAALRGFQDWTLRYWLQSVPGVAEVASIGGFQKQYQVNVNPNALTASESGGGTEGPPREGSSSAHPPRTAAGAAQDREART